MNINKDGKTLYFSDDEIEKEINGGKKVYVTKRIKEKETGENNNFKNFNFENEIVIGINKPSKEENKKKKSNKKLDSNIKIRKKIKNKKRKIRRKILTSILGIIIIVITIVVLALTTPIFNIEDIQVTGNNKLSKETIINLSGLKEGNNIFKFNNQVILNIKENSYIETATIKRKLPSTVIINIEERKIAYQISLINSYVYIDKNGYILENSATKSNEPILVGLKIKEEELLERKRLDQDDLLSLNKILKIMDASKSIEIDNIITEIKKEEENFILYIESKNKKIYLGDESNLTNKMLYIKKILENEEGKSGSIFVNGNSNMKPFFREE